MKDNNEKDELRFDKLYNLLGDEVNEIYETGTSDNTKEETKMNEAPVFSDVFNIFNNKPLNYDAFTMPTDNKKSEETNNEYLEELNKLIDDYNSNPDDEYQKSINSIFSEETDVFKKPAENIINEEKPISLVDELPKEVTSNEITNTKLPTIKPLNEEDNIDALSHEETMEESSIIPKDDEVPKEIINEEIYIEPAKIEITDKLTSKTKKETKTSEYNPDNKNKIRNQTLITGKNIYDDGLDDTCAKMSIIDFLAQNKIQRILLFIIFIIVCILVHKAFRFSKLVNVYNEYTNETGNTKEAETQVYDDEVVDIETLKKAAASELIDCINSPVDTNELSPELNDIIKEINAYYRTSGNYFAFAYRDLFTGFTVSYNENSNVFAASTIKAPVNIYLYEMASQGKINLDEELTYTSQYYNNGTGVLKNKPVNTNYSIRTLSEYAIRNSDNAAHNMLMDKYGRSNIKDFWQAKGTNIILTGGDNWGLINAHDAMIYMKELYTFYINNDEYGNELMTNFLNAKTKFITGNNDYKVANKSGWSGTAQHDVSIIFAENPYVVVALSHLGYNNNYMGYFNRVNDLAYQLHNEYWKYKIAMCGNIKQYD